MSADAVLESVRARGLVLEVSGDNLIARPKSALTDETRALLRAHKAELIAALKQPARTASWRWRVTQPDGYVFHAYYTPPAKREEVEKQYQGAAVQPMPDERDARPPTEAEVAELRRLVAVVYADDNEADRAEALAMALADAESALACYRSLAFKAGRSE